MLGIHDENVRGLNCKRIQCDEIWSFCYAKEKNTPCAKNAPTFAGDVWTWTSICADSKLICNWFVSGRDAEYAKHFANDLAARLNHSVQMTTDGHKAYLNAIDGAFGADIDYAMLIKLFGASPDSAKGRYYSPAECTGMKKTKLCLTVDAYAGNAIGAPTDSISRFKNMQAACATITERWNNIEPRVGAVF